MGDAGGSTSSTTGAVITWGGNRSMPDRAVDGDDLMPSPAACAAFGELLLVSCKLKDFLIVCGSSAPVESAEEPAPPTLRALAVFEP